MAFAEMVHAKLPKACSRQRARAAYAFAENQSHWWPNLSVAFPSVIQSSALQPRSSPCRHLESYSSNSSSAYCAYWTIVTFLVPILALLAPLSAQNTSASCIILSISRSLLETTSTNSRCPRREKPVDIVPSNPGFSVLQPRSSPCRQLRVIFQHFSFRVCVDGPVTSQPFLASILTLLDSLSAQDSSAFCAMRSISSCGKRSFSLVLLI